MSYAHVHIVNSTPYPITGEVHYMSAFCSNDHYSIAPNGDWEAGSRGACLVTKIDATVDTPQGPVGARPYESSGTSYAQFGVIAIGGNAFEVTRRVNGEEDKPPADYEEPTSEQK